MRERTEKCVVTFRTTAGAMAMGAACKGPAGRRLCWAAPPDSREALEELVMKKHLDVDGIYAIIL